MRVLLSLDLSTSCTGWAKFDLDSKQLLSFGAIYPGFKNPKVKGNFLYNYPELHVYKFRELCVQVLQLIDESVEEIVIEEINRGKNRLGQKVLDGFHFVLLDRLEKVLNRIKYIDSDGKSGWRSAEGLNLRLSEFDKKTNKERKTMNKRLGRTAKKLPLITQKTLACNYVNKVFGLSLNEDLDSSHGDMADAIGLGYFYLHKKPNKVAI